MALLTSTGISTSFPVGKCRSSIRLTFMKMTRTVESVVHICESDSPFLMTLLIKPSGSGDRLTAGAAVARGDAFVLSAAYPDREQLERHNTIITKIWQIGLLCDKKVFTAAENICFL